MAYHDRRDNSEDMFADTRMTFGEHLEDLRAHLLRALFGFGIALFFSFFVGKPVLQIISAPVEKQLGEFYHKRSKEVYKDAHTDARLREANQPRWVKMAFNRSQLDAAVRGQSSSADLSQLPD